MSHIESKYEGVDVTEWPDHLQTPLMGHTISWHISVCMTLLRGLPSGHQQEDCPSYSRA